VIRAIAQVAERLGNTPAVCRKCYVHPQVIAAYLDGTLADALDGADPEASSSPSRSTAHLAPAEAAVLALLQRRARDERRGTTLVHQLRDSLRAA
jgi:DNA topoisomerase-1